MASGFTTTHACHCWSQTYKSLKRKVSRPDGVLEEAQASPARWAALTKTLRVQPFTSSLSLGPSRA